VPTVDLVVETPISTSIRARQASAMFDVPAQEKCTLRWRLDVPIDTCDWNVGLIVGPSGSGKSTLARHLFGEPTKLAWGAPSVIDDFAEGHSIDAIAETCGAVGFNTIPAWLRPYAVLSNGEKFRVELARLLLEGGHEIVVDEFTSVVDRQIAQIGSHAVQKYLRRHGRRFVAVTCHYDVIDWLQPDWILDMATRSFTRRRLQRRPAVECEVRRVPYDVWRVFAPFHYLTAELHRSARCFALFANGHLASFAGLLYRPHPKADDIMGVSRLVTLPDWQGLGLAMALVDVLGAAHRATGRRLHTYPAHPALIRSFDRSKHWRLERAPGARYNFTREVARDGLEKLGGRPSAVFAYAGEAMEIGAARRFLGDGR
jgi:ABC-type transport system involved in cytochrome c biogenesis ATPase subunit